MKAWRTQFLEDFACHKRDMKYGGSTKSVRALGNPSSLSQVWVLDTGATTAHLSYTSQTLIFH